MRNKAIKNGLSKLENKDWFPFDTSDWINFDEFDGIGNKQSFIEEYGKYYRKNKRMLLKSHRRQLQSICGCD